MYTPVSQFNRHWHLRRLLYTQTQINTFFGRKNAHEGVKISFNDDGAISVTLYVSISYGYRIPDIALRLQERIKTALVNYTEIEVETIDIVVQDIIFDDFTPEPIQRNE